MLAAPLKVVGAGVVVEEGVEEEVEVIEREEEVDLVLALEAVAAGVVELPTGKGTAATVVEVTGGATGVEEVEEVDVIGVVEVVDVLDVLEVEAEVEVLELLEVDEEVDEAAAPGVLAMMPEPEPEQG